MASVSSVVATRMGRRPIRSDSAPEIGSQKKFEAPTAMVTSRLSDSASFRTFLPKEGV